MFFPYCSKQLLLLYIAYICLGVNAHKLLSFRKVVLKPQEAFVAHAVVRQFTNQDFMVNRIESYISLLTLHFFDV